jgi:hypothetical protein
MYSKFILLTVFLMMISCERPDPSIERCVQAGLNKKLTEAAIDRQLDILDHPEEGKKLGDVEIWEDKVRDKKSAEYKGFLNTHEYEIRKECMRSGAR